MAVSDTLDELRAQFPECALIAFTDLSADMVLAKSAAQDMPQERWDGLCAMARDVLRQGAAAQAIRCLGNASEAKLSRAVLMTQTECDVFLAAADAPDYVLCAVGQASLRVASFYTAAQPILDRLVQDD